MHVSFPNNYVSKKRSDFSDFRINNNNSWCPSQQLGGDYDSSCMSHSPIIMVFFSKKKEWLKNKLRGLIICADTG